MEIIRELSEENKIIYDSLEKGFNRIGLVIKPIDGKSRKLEEWYGYIIIETAYYKELTWLMNKILKIFGSFFNNMESREYLFDHLGVRIQKALINNDIDIVFWEVIDESQKLIKKIKEPYLN